MRNWLFHPLLFYPLALLFGALVIAVSLKPQAWPRDPAPVAPPFADGALVISGASFNSPDPGFGQNVTVTRDFLGTPLNLRVAVLPGEGFPGMEEAGVRILLTEEEGALISDRATYIDVTYNSLPVNTSKALGISLQGMGETFWAVQNISPQPATIRYEMPPQNAVNAIGIRAVHDGGDQAFGVEITRIRIIPRA